MWQCTKCNTMNEGAFCSACGAKHVEEPIRTTSAATRTLIICMVVLLLFLGVVVVGLLLWISDYEMNTRMESETNPVQQVVIQTPAPVEPQVDVPSETITENTQYFTYRNFYGDFSVDVPTFLEEETSDSTAAYYVSADGRVTMDINSWPAGDVFNNVDELYNHVKSGIIYEINYDRKKDNWFVLSGEDSDVVYYQYHIFTTDGLECSFILTYPKAREKEFDEIVTHIYHSFELE